MICTRSPVSASCKASCPLLLATASVLPSGLYRQVENSPLPAIFIFSCPKVSTALLSIRISLPTPDVAKSCFSESGWMDTDQHPPGFLFFGAVQVASSFPSLSSSNEKRDIWDSIVHAMAKVGALCDFSASRPTIAAGWRLPLVEGVIVARASVGLAGSL